MIDEDFKRIRRKFQGKCFKWDRIDKKQYPFTYYYRITKIIHSKPDMCLVISDCIIMFLDKTPLKHITFQDRCKYKDRSFYATFGKRIIPSLYKKKLLEYNRQGEKQESR